MFGQPGYTPYNGYINPMAPAQQRLAQMEAQYPQFSQGGVTPCPQVGGPLTTPQGSQTGFIKGRVVTSIDEVKGAMIDLDGGIHVFTDFGNHKIYTKQINLDGTATINTYVLETPAPVKEVETVNKEEFNSVVQSGCSLTLNTASIRVNKSGLYHLSADVTYTPTAAGVAIIQLYKDGVALPCAISQRTVTAGTVYTDHIETDLCLTTCCVNRPLITLDISGVAGTVNHTCVGMVKLA